VHLSDQVVAQSRKLSILCPMALVALGAALLGGTVATDSQAEIEAYDRSFDGYCESVEDFMDCRPTNTGGNRPGTEDILLEWGREQGIEGLDGKIPLSRRRQALDRVYQLIRKRYLPGAVTAKDAPDAGVKVLVGEPRVVMFAPEGKTADKAGNIARLGHLGPNFKKEGRWGQYMFPEVNRLKGGWILVRVSVGGDGDRNYLDYVSGDGGKNWRYFARYEEGAEMPSRDWAALQLPDGEEIKVAVPQHDPRNIFGYVKIDVPDKNIKLYGSSYLGRQYYRLGDLPRDLQGVTLLRRKAGEEGGGWWPEQKWSEDKAYLDPDLLVRDSLPNPLHGLWLHETKILPDGSLVRADFKSLPMISDLRPDGTLGPEPHRVLRSSDRGRTWKVAAEIPGSNFYPFWFKGLTTATVRVHLLAFPNGNWLAAFRHGGIYWSGGGPLIVRKSSDQGKTWSEPKAIRMPGVNPSGLVLENGIAVMSYQRPGVFLTFCADGQGDSWGNDVTLVKAWRHARNENSCCNGTFLATGPDRFLYVYTKWDVPDPWGQPRLAVIAQEFVVSKK